MPERELDEFEIRKWFMTAELEQARDTFRVVEGILQTREQFTPKRKRRSDAGQKRLEALPFDRSQTLDDATMEAEEKQLRRSELAK